MRVEDFDKGATGHVTHDRYLTKQTVDGVEKRFYSGRLICRLKTESPTVIGAEQERQSEKNNNGEEIERKIHPYQIDGEPAIPESSLRGLISSIAEAASNSAMRVLEDIHLSIRHEMRYAMHHIGMLVDDGSGRIKLRPLAIPPYHVDTPYISDIDKRLFPYSYLKQYAPLRVYIDGYKKTNNSPPSIAIDEDSFLGKEQPASYSSNLHKFWYMKLYKSYVDHKGKITCTPRKTKKQPEWVIGQQASGDPVSVSENAYTRGILRVLGIKGRKNDIPTSKKHEIFIPYPEEAEKIPLIDAHDALTKFHSLADARTAIDDTLPYQLQGMRKETIDEVNLLRLKSGDLVFFRPEQNGDEVIITELAVSSIWRQDKGTLFEYFDESSRELLPMNPDRTTISIAEQLFGFVELGGENTRTLAGRLRFSSGRLGTEQTAPFLDTVLLKILASPKPPSPGLYFKHKDYNKDNPDNKISKKDLCSEKHAPQGRKHYLHPRPEPVEDNEKNPPWETLKKYESRSLKAEVTPLKSNLSFYFHIDFDNLSETELGLLLYAIKPSEKFRHKLGMGKPIGLGMVHLEPVMLCQINRLDRYMTSDLFNNRRYSSIWKNSGLIETDSTELSALSTLYSRENKEFEDMETSKPDDLIDSNWVECIRSHIALEIKDKYPVIVNAIDLLGNPENIKNSVQLETHEDIKNRVHYPQLPDLSLESELFKWFMENEKPEGKAYLKPIKENTKDIPVLNRNPKITTDRDDENQNQCKKLSSPSLILQRDLEDVL